MQGAPRISCICNGDHCTSSLAIPSWVTSSHLQLGQFSPKNVSLLWFSKQSRSRLGSLPPDLGCLTPVTFMGQGCVRLPVGLQCPLACTALMPHFPLNHRWKNHLYRSLGSQQVPLLSGQSGDHGKDAGKHLLPPRAEADRRGSIQSKL